MYIWTIFGFTFWYKRKPLFLRIIFDIIKKYRGRSQERCRYNLFAYYVEIFILLFMIE